MRRTALLAFLAAAYPAQTDAACMLELAYQPRAKAPFIEAAPSNAGLYVDLYTEAATRVGCALSVKRMPKKRIVALMKLGEVDLYPGFKFTEKRARYAHFVANGLSTGRIGLSRSGLPQVMAPGDLTGLRVAISLGGVNYAKRVAGATVVEVANLDVARAAEMLRAGRVDFYATDPADIGAYMRSTEDNGLEVHEDCCGGRRPMYLGIARRSEHAMEVANAHYDANAPSGPRNVPTVLSGDSLAHRLAQALLDMRADGTTERLAAMYADRTGDLLLPQ